jgi:hypothetical protein
MLLAGGAEVTIVVASKRLPVVDETFCRLLSLFKQDARGLDSIESNGLSFVR